MRESLVALFDWDKGLTAAAFAVAADENEKCVILVATDAYGMGIDILTSSSSFSGIYSCLSIQ